MNDGNGIGFEFILGFIAAFLGFVALWLNIRPAAE